MLLTLAVACATTAVAFLGPDAIWLSKMSSGYYRASLGDLLLAEPRLGVAAAFYIVYVFGLVHFAVLPALTTGNWTTALVNGALLGLVAYGTYDMTNLATLRGWSLQLSLVDLAWGIALSGFAATCGFLVTAALFPSR